MGPTRFSIEIPDRPVYQPGSGPAMAPITLQPDDSNTGWVIAGTVDFQGTSQYVVTPKDNPAHRRPVVKQHILDWVSPKAYEDFEYEQYKSRTEAERERSSHIVAKSTSIKRRSHGTGLAKRPAKMRKPFARYMQLEQVQDSDKGTTGEELSSPEHSSDDLSRDFFRGHVETTKRKRSAGFLHPKVSALKRRGLSDSGSTSLAWKAWTRQSFRSRKKRQVEMAEDETDAEEKARAISTSTFIDLTDVQNLEGHILPPQRRVPTPPRASIPPNPSTSSHSASSMFIPATASPSRMAPELHWSGLSPPLIAASKPRPAPASAQPKATPPKEATLLHPSNRGKARAPILPPIGLWPISEPINAIPGFVSNSAAVSSDSKRQKRKRHSLSPVEDGATVEEYSEANCTGRQIEPRQTLATLEKTSMGRSQFSDSTLSRGRRPLGIPHSPKQKRRKASRSSSSGSSNVLRWPSQRKGPPVANKQSEYFDSMRMMQKDKEDAEDDDDGESGGSEETWDIHGILDDEKRRVNGRLVRYYLCEWVGDWDPTWEPEGNVSKDAITRYEKKTRRNSQGFDGAIDVDILSENGWHLDGKSSGRFDSHIEQEKKSSNSGARLNAHTEATRLSSSDQVPLPPSGPSNTNGKGVLVGVE